MPSVLINDTDSTAYNAILTHKEISLCEVAVYDDWLKNAMNPLYFGKQEKYKTLKLTFFINNGSDNDNDNALKNVSNLVAALEKCTLKFDDSAFYYDCIITDTGTPEQLGIGIYTIEVTLKAPYAYLPLVSQWIDINFDGTKDTSIDKNIQGNIPVPIIINAQILSADSDQNFKFNVPSNVDTSTNGWIKNGFIIRPLYKGMELTVDSERCLVYQGVDFAVANDFKDFWGDFVTLQPGLNSIPVGLESLSGTVQIRITISYKPRFI
ncbi:hypothetical protein [Clostridium coskatii]|uniref:Phage tail protein n=1 Tax=Clostridium coskatii TaxID=1705578 RepID=A0A166RDA9_9CLOT|nr:hypothetical protein [Clostridium coskatii]OAA90703.1 Phage tail protein [Clostridium coskatii]OBR97461.1 phage tail protein [Clostridium coskatii]